MVERKNDIIERRKLSNIKEQLSNVVLLIGSCDVFIFFLSIQLPPEFFN